MAKLLLIFISSFWFSYSLASAAPVQKTVVCNITTAENRTDHYTQVDTLDFTNEDNGGCGGIGPSLRKIQNTPLYFHYWYNLRCDVASSSRPQSAGYISLIELSGGAPDYESIASAQNSSPAINPTGPQKLSMDAVTTVNGVRYHVWIACETAPK